MVRFDWLQAVTPVLVSVIVALAVFIITAVEMSVAYFHVIINLCRAETTPIYGNVETPMEFLPNIIQEQPQAASQDPALTENAIDERVGSQATDFKAQVTACRDGVEGGKQDEYRQDIGPANDCLEDFFFKLSDFFSKLFDFFFQLSDLFFKLFDFCKPRNPSHPPFKDSSSEQLQSSGMNPSSECAQNCEPSCGTTNEGDNVDDNDEDGDDDEDENTDEDEFAAVKQAVNLEAIKQKAIECRARQLALSRPEEQELSSIRNLCCEFDPKPMYGSYNLIYVLRWSDGIKWVARIPSIGCEFGLFNAAKMESEYQTMEYIRKNTSLPIPQVFCLSWLPHLAGVPFALLSFVEGDTLYNFWKEESSTTEEQKFGVVNQVAKYMAELSRLRFPKDGMLCFDHFEGGPTVGPSLEMIWDEASQSSKPGLARQSGSMKEKLVACLEEAHCVVKEDECATSLLTKMAVESIPDYMAADGQYTVCLDDFDLQNVMVDKNGGITGFLDWDGVHIGPMALGAVSYPMWITRDWQAGYGWGDDELMEAYPEDSPEQLSGYRRHYLETMMACQGSDYNPRWTKLSHVLAIVTKAAECYFSASGELVILLEGCKVPFQLKDYADSFKEGDTQEKDKLIREAFNSIWDTYQETPNQIRKSHQDPDVFYVEEEEADAEHNDGDNAKDYEDDSATHATGYEDGEGPTEGDNSGVAQTEETSSVL